MHCFVPLRRLGALLLALGACLASAPTVLAQSVPHKASGNGQITSFVGNRMDWVAAGHGTQIGNYTEAGHHFLFADGTLNGFFTITAADGATTSGIFYGSYFDLGGGFTGFNVTVEWLEGTGRLEGVTGIGSAAARLENATGKISIVVDAVWNNP